MFRGKALSPFQLQYADMLLKTSGHAEACRFLAKVLYSASFTDEEMGVKMFRGYPSKFVDSTEGADTILCPRIQSEIFG